MTTPSNKRNIFVGLFVFIATVFLIAGILLIGNINDTFTPKMEIVSIFDDVAGLKKGDNVWFSGVKIGTVSQLNFHNKSQVEVAIKIDRETQKYIRKDAKVKLGSDGVIGNRILIIYGGTDQAPAVEIGDVLEVEKTLTTEEMIHTLQANNNNLLAITGDFKILSKRLVDGVGTLGKLLTDDSAYNNINQMTQSLQNATVNAEEVFQSLSAFTSKLSKEGTLAYDLSSDTLLFRSIKESVLQLELIADSARVLVANLNRAGTNPNSSIGVLLHDEQAGKQLKETIVHLESSSKKLDEDLEAIRHNFLFKRYFKKKAKSKSELKE